MSRPIASVPSRNSDEPPCCQNGGRRKAALLVVSGACGAIHGANSASSSRVATTTSPPTAPWFCENDSQNSRHGPGGVDCCEGATGGATAAISVPSLPDAWIDESVSHVDQQVHRHHHHAEQQHAALQHRV